MFTRCPQDVHGNAVRGGKTDTRRKIFNDEESERQAKKSLVNLVVFFNQCKQYTDFDKMNEMDREILLLTYETLLEQKSREMQEYEKLQNRV